MYQTQDDDVEEAIKASYYYEDHPQQYVNPSGFLSGSETDYFLGYFNKEIFPPIEEFVTPEKEFPPPSPEPVTLDTSPDPYTGAKPDDLEELFNVKDVG